MTVEDPSDDFQRLRNFVDARLCKGLKSFGRDAIKKGFNKEMIREARETFKVSCYNLNNANIIYFLFLFLMRS